MRPQPLFRHLPSAASFRPVVGHRFPLLFDVLACCCPLSRRAAQSDRHLRISSAAQVPRMCCCCSCRIPLDVLLFFCRVAPPVCEFAQPRRCKRIAVLTTNRPGLLLRRNQLHPTRGRTRPCRIVPVNSPPYSPAYSVQPRKQSGIPHETITVSCGIGIFFLWFPGVTSPTCGSTFCQGL